MHCRTCQFDNPAGMRFCGQCGAPLAAACPQCGAEIPAGFRFCGQCGMSLEPPTSQSAAAPPPKPTAATALPPSVASYTPKHLAEKILKSRSALEGERRQVTVLFADVAGFTSLAEKLDPEEVHKLINGCFELVTAEIHRFEGTINQYTGDGVMALFGAPIAHEDNARRAVHAALGIQRALRKYASLLDTERGLTLAMRIGLNTGSVVVGRIGDDLRMDYTAVGDTTNLAARMQQAARPGSVMMTEATHKAVEGFFETLDLGPVAVKGHEPIHAFEVLRARGARSRMEIGVDRGLTPFIGRERELGVLLDRFAEVAAGRGQVVYVTGDAGIGKSRLLHEFRRAGNEDAGRLTWLEGQCVSFGHSIAFLPLIDQLRKNFHIGEYDGEPEIIAKVEHGMRLMGELESHVPFIRYLLSVDPGDPIISTMDAASRHRLVFAALRALTLRGARQRPLVLLIEDLHWIDSSSEEYLGYLMDSMGAVPVMLILTYRVGYVPRFRTHSFQSSVSLTTMAERDALAVACGVLGATELPSEVTAAIMEKAEGVPLFIEEVAKTLLDIGVLRREKDRLTLVKGAGQISVPDTINDIIMARLDRLGEDGKRTVQLASVIGREFLVRLLSRVAGMTEQLDGLLRELQALEIIYEKGLLAEPAYIFKHAVIQDVAYNSLLRERRKDLHRAVAYAVEELFPDRLAEHYEELAHHFSLGEDWAKAFEYLDRSGDRAKYAYANQVALDFYGRALEAAARATPPIDPGRIIQIHQKRSQVFVLLSRYLEAVAESEQMLALARSGGDRRAESEALVDIAFAYFNSFRSEFAVKARRCAEDAQAIAREIGDERLLARSLTCLGAFDQADGNLTEGDRKFTESLRLSEAGGFKHSVAQNRMYLSAHANWQGQFRRSIEIARGSEAAAAEIHDGVIELYGLAFRCLSEIGLGQYATAWATITDGLAKAKDWNNAFMEGRLTNSLGWLYQELGAFERALDLDLKSADIGQRIKNPNVEISALINVAFDHCHRGEPQRALAILEDTAVRVEKFAFGAHRWRWSIHIATYLAEMFLATGQPALALEHTDRALLLARSTGSRKYVGRCLALRGQAALAEGNLVRAVAELGEALRVAREIEYPTLTWQAADLLAQAHAADGRLAEALSSIQLAADTLARVAAGAPEPTLRQSLMTSPRVQTVYETLERLRQSA